MLFLLGILSGIQNYFPGATRALFSPNPHFTSIKVLPSPAMLVGPLVTKALQTGFSPASWWWLLEGGNTADA